MLHRLILIVLLASLPAIATERSPQADAEISFLLEHVRDSQLVFIRNGKAHDAEQAHEHMQAKYQHFDRKIDSAESFIEHSASRSLISGRPYRIRLPDGSEQEARRYLLDRLAEYRTDSATEPH